jgi:hypothetical protein
VRVAPAALMTASHVRRTEVKTDHLDLRPPPRRGQGKVTAEVQAERDADLKDWCARLLLIKPRLDFDPGLRGWCYVMEEYGLDKSGFDWAQSLITRCRKNGMLPLDFTSEGAGREFINIEKLDADPEEQAKRIVNYVDGAHLTYTPLSFWEFQETYVEMLVEKVGLRNLFEQPTAHYHVALGNTRGSWSINMRVEMLLRFARWQAAGKQCVLLYCGDHDIHGLRISTALRKNLEEVLPALQRTYPNETSGFNLDHVLIERFGLNADFIKRHRLTWIEGLITGSGATLVTLTTISTSIVTCRTTSSASVKRSARPTRWW